MDYRQFPPGQSVEPSYPVFPESSSSRYHPSDDRRRHLEAKDDYPPYHGAPQRHVSLPDHHNYNGYHDMQAEPFTYTHAPTNMDAEPSQARPNSSQHNYHNRRVKSDLSISSDSLGLHDQYHASRGSVHGRRLPSYPLAPHEAPAAMEKSELPHTAEEAEESRLKERTMSMKLPPQANLRPQAASEQDTRKSQTFSWSQHQDADMTASPLPRYGPIGSGEFRTHDNISQQVPLSTDVPLRARFPRGPSENRGSMYYPDNVRLSYGRYSPGSTDHAGQYGNSVEMPIQTRSRRYTQQRRRSSDDGTEDEGQNSYHKTRESDGAIYFERKYVSHRRPPAKGSFLPQELRVYDNEDADNEQEEVPRKKSRGGWFRDKFEKLAEIGSSKRRASSKKKKMVCYLPLADERHCIRVTDDAGRRDTRAVELGLGYGHYTNEQLHCFWRILAEALSAPTPAVDRINRLLPRLMAEDVRTVRQDYRNHVRVKDDDGNYQPVCLSKQMASAVGGYFGEICTAVILGRFRSELFFIEKYYHQEIPRRDFLVEALVGRTNPEMETIVKAFGPDRYHSRLRECLADELPDETKHQTALFRALTSPRDDERRPVDREAIELTVDAMCRALNSKDGGDEKMIAALMSRNAEYLREFLRRYRTVHGVSFGAEVLKKCSSFVAEILAHLFNGAVNRQLRDAMYLNFALHECRETHANEESIFLLTSRLVRYHWEPIHMMRVDATYQNRFNISLRQDIMDLMPFHEDRQLPDEKADYKDWLDFCVGLVVSSTSLGKKMLVEGR